METLNPYISATNWDIGMKQKIWWCLLFYIYMKNKSFICDFARIEMMSSTIAIQIYII